MFKKVYIEITNICNKHCSFCSITKREKKEMSIEEFTHTIKEVKKVTNYIYLHVKGEPLLHSKIKEIIDICDNNELFVNITTNATLLTKYKELIKNSKSIRQINISLHSYKNEDLDNLFNTVDYLNKNTKIYFVYRFWLGNKLFKDSLVIKQLLDHYNLNINDVDINNIKLNNTLYINKDEEFVWPNINNSYYSEEGYCLGLKSHIGILSDGTVIPCCLDSEGIINLGNIHKESIEDILNKERTKNIINSFRNNKKIEELCKHCSFKN